jgi:prepilin-type processing-associated H-X9-DG protein
MVCPENQADPYSPALFPSKYCYATLAGMHFTSGGYVSHGLDQIQSPSYAVFMTDAASMFFWATPRCNYYVDQNTWRWGIGFDLHNGANIGFMDGHVQRVKREDFDERWIQQPYVMGN